VRTRKNISCVHKNITLGRSLLCYVPDLHKDMKQYIRDIMDDLNKDENKDFIPVLPQTPTGGKTVYLDPPRVETDPQDLSNQDLSSDPQERVEQLDYQAQENEERETLG
jgi:hypothetical protein